MIVSRLLYCCASLLSLVSMSYGMSSSTQSQLEKLQGYSPSLNKHRGQPAYVLKHKDMNAYSTNKSNAESSLVKHQSVVSDILACQENNDRADVEGISLTGWMKRGLEQTRDTTMDEIRTLADAIVTKMAADDDESGVLRPKLSLLERLARKCEARIMRINDFIPKKSFDREGDDSYVESVEFNHETKQIRTIIKDPKRDETITVYGDIKDFLSRRLIIMNHNANIRTNKQYHNSYYNQDHDFAIALDYVVQLLGDDTHEHSSKRSDDQKYLYALVERTFSGEVEPIRCIAEYAYTVPSEANGRKTHTIYHRLLRRRPNQKIDPKFKNWLEIQPNETK